MTRNAAYNKIFSSNTILSRLNELLNYYFTIINFRLDNSQKHNCDAIW